MHGDNASTNLGPSPQQLYRGLYVRVARKLGVDPSYVSRVARGDRHSEQIASALREELETISLRLEPRRNNGRGQSGRTIPKQRLTNLVKQHRNRIHKQWLSHSHADPALRRAGITAQKRTAPIRPVIEEAMKVMKLSVKQMAGAPMKAAQQHGRLRQAQGFSAMALVEEYNLVRRCVFTLAQEHFQQLEPQLLIRDLTQFGEALDLQTQRALRHYLAAA
jgi:hypothetical protein